jgi:hypothetical protein
MTGKSMTRKKELPRFQWIQATLEVPVNPASERNHSSIPDWRRLAIRRSHGCSSCSSDEDSRPSV